MRRHIFSPSLLFSFSPVSVSQYSLAGLLVC
uniref:Uncharacterized protein n=1 Tax=Arundo donax TaxID=35708 RepID=A0A0A9A9U6_ARUDO